MKSAPVLVCLIIVSVLTLSSNVNASTKGSHFVLVHGAGHGAWCWYKVATLLESTGHNVTTIDLMASGIDPSHVSQVNRSVIDYSKPLTDFMESLPTTENNKVILVGHGLGGISITIAMEIYPHKISAAVFVAALMPGFNLGYRKMIKEITRRAGPPMDSKLIYDDGPKYPPIAVILGPLAMKTAMYQLSPPQDLVLALSLVRPFPLFNNAELTIRQVQLSKRRFGSVKRVFIVCDQDLTYDESFQRWMIKENRPHEVKVINGTDHMVMFTKPLKLFALLGEIADKYSPMK